MPAAALAMSRSGGKTTIVPKGTEPDLVALAVADDVLTFRGDGLGTAVSLSADGNQGPLGGVCAASRRCRPRAAPRRPGGSRWAAAVRPRRSFAAGRAEPAAGRAAAGLLARPVWRGRGACLLRLGGRAPWRCGLGPRLAGGR